MKQNRCQDKNEMFCFFIDFLRLYPYSVLVGNCPKLNKESLSCQYGR